MTRSSSPFVTSAAEEEEEVRKLRRMEGENAGGGQSGKGCISFTSAGVVIDNNCLDFFDRQLLKRHDAGMTS
jgi:hypothetical protein